MLVVVALAAMPGVILRARELVVHALVGNQLVHQRNRGDGARRAADQLAARDFAWP